MARLPASRIAVSRAAFGELLVDIIKAIYLLIRAFLVPASAPTAEKVGTLRGEGFSVEKLIYETRPHHHVTALLYLPEGGPSAFPRRTHSMRAQ